MRKAEREEEGEERIKKNLPEGDTKQYSTHREVLERGKKEEGRWSG